MKRTRSAGFVITLEFLLVMALFVVPLIIGAIMVGRKLFTLYLNQRDFIDQPYSRAVVWDSSATPKSVGPVMGYDQFEAPLVIFRDEATKGGVVLGVRPSRFTSVGAVYYDTANCLGVAYVRRPLAFNTIGSGGILYYPPNGVAYQMQGVSYGMGNGNVLYKSATSVVGAQPSVTSVWMSQDTTSGPCYSSPGLGTLPNDLVPASAVVDFDSGPANPDPYTPPFRLAFPTPGTPTDPSPSCATAECP